MLDTAEALDFIEGMPKPDACDPALIQLARFSREENERIRGMLEAVWNVRPRAVEEELFR